MVSVPPKLEIDLGYQFLRTSSAGSGISYPLGFDVRIAKPITPRFFIVGGFDWARHSETITSVDDRIPPLNSYDELSGAYLGFKVKMLPVSYSGRSITSIAFRPIPEASLIAHLEHQSGSIGAIDRPSSNNFVLQPGVSVAVPIRQGSRLSVFGRVDYRRVFSTIPQNNVDLVAGVRVTIE